MIKLLIIAVLFANVYVTTLNGTIINKNIKRVIDLSTQLVKISAAITFENTGKYSETKYIVMLESSSMGNLSFISAKDSYKEELKITKSHNEHGQAFTIKLNHSVATGSTSTIDVELVFTNSQAPYPSSIVQKGKQLMRYFGNHYFYSPYLTLKQTTLVIVNTRSIENYSELIPVSRSGSRIIYGPYNGIRAFTIDPMVVHFENNSPFLTVTRLKRLIEVSHWGKIAVEENIDILHTGAKLKGVFSRYDYQKEPSNSQHCIKSYKTVMPAAAHNIYYRDTNGNISTSQVRTRNDCIELELRPRYPLFGGWKSSYMLGYSVPSYEYLFNEGNNEYLLRIRLMDNVFDDMHVDYLETNVVLPFGATNINPRTPYEVVVHKYIDMEGRPIIKFSKKNLVEQHIQDLEVTYEWQPLLFLHKPLLLSIAIYLLFVIVIVYVRLDFSISKMKMQ